MEKPRTPRRFKRLRDAGQDAPRREPEIYDPNDPEERDRRYPEPPPEAEVWFR